LKLDQWSLLALLCLCFLVRCSPLSLTRTSFLLFLLLFSSLASCGRQSVAFEHFSGLALEIPAPMVWLEPIVLSVRGTPVRVGIWINQQASISDFLNQVCALVGDLANEDDGPLDPKNMYVASTSGDYKHIRRRLSPQTCVDVIKVEFPLVVFEVPRVSCFPDPTAEKRVKEQEEEVEEEEEEAEAKAEVEAMLKRNPNKIVHRMRLPSGRYELIGTPSLIFVEEGSSTLDVAKVACVLVAKICADLLQQEYQDERRSNEYDDQELSDDEESYEMVERSDNESLESSTLSEEPWRVMLNSTLCEINVVQGSKRVDLDTESGEAMFFEDDRLASEVVRDFHSTICFDWLPELDQSSVLDLSIPENYIMHPSFTMERESGSVDTTDPPYATSTNSTNSSTNPLSEAAASAQGKETVITLAECIDQFTAVEHLSAQCECGEPVVDANDVTTETHSKKLSFTRLPPVLVVSFKRFKNIHVKNETLISFPITNFDMSEWVEDDGMGNGGMGNNRNNCMYDLVAVVNHRGRLGYGHYTAYGLTEQGSWALYDDEKVTMVGTSEEAEDFLPGAETAESLRLSEALVTRKAYLLIYVQRGSHKSKKSKC